MVGRACWTFSKGTGTPIVAILNVMSLNSFLALDLNAAVAAVLSVVLTLVPHVAVWRVRTV